MIFPLIITAFIQLFKPCIIKLIIRASMERKRNKKESIQTTMVTVCKILQRNYRCQALLNLWALSLSIFASGFSLCLKLEIPWKILSVNPSNLTAIYVCLSLIWEKLP